jgi:hypothetical protein
VRRLGGFGIAAHPDSPKPQLEWRDWASPFDGVELLNPDTSWRILAARSGWQPKARLLTALLDYPLRSAEVMASLIQPTRAMIEWESLAERRRVVVTAGADAHSKLALRNVEPGDTRWVLPLPSYESSFRLLSERVRTDGPLTGTAAADARLVMRAIRAGHLHAVVDGLATPPSFEFSATNEHGTVHEGDQLTASGPAMLHVKTNAPADYTTVIHEGGRTLAAMRDAQDWTVHGSDHPAVFWVEILAPGREAPITWLRSNPIYVRSADAPETPAARPAATDSRMIFDGQRMDHWYVEHDPTSVAAVELAPVAGGNELRLRYGLAGGLPPGQVVTLAYDTPGGIAPNTRVTFTIRAEHPMRVSVQLRGGDGRGPDDRWSRSIYVDASNQERTVAFDDMTPVGVTRTAKPVPANVHSVLFVIDRPNAVPGSSGRVWIKSAALQR